MDKFELALQFGLSELVVAYTCSLGLATPTVVMVATGKRSASVLVKTVVFDETRTLTVGKLVVVDDVPLLQLLNGGVLCCAIATKANSEHPMAKSVLEHAKRQLKTFGSTKHVMEAKDFEVHAGAGISGRVGDKMVLAGNNWHICGKTMSRLVLRLTSMFQNMRIWLERVCWLPSMERLLGHLL
ncbi:hypothetical protein TB2_029427 [Malus domestica]